MKLCLGLLVGLAACAHQAAPATTARPFELRQLCSDPLGHTWCSPVTPDAPQVDTNLASPPHTSRVA